MAGIRHLFAFYSTAKQPTSRPDNYQAIKV